MSTHAAPLWLRRDIYTTRYRFTRRGDVYLTRWHLFQALSRESVRRIHLPFMMVLSPADSSVCLPSSCTDKRAINSRVKDTSLIRDNKARLKTHVDAIKPRRLHESAAPLPGTRSQAHTWQDCRICANRLRNYGNDFTLCFH